MKRTMRFPVISLFVMLAAALLLSQLFSMGSTPKVEEMTYTKLLEQVEKDGVSRLAITDEAIVGLYKDTTLDPKDFPQKYDFMANKLYDSAKIYNDIDRIIAKKTGKPVDELSTLDYPFVMEDVQPERIPFWWQFVPYLVMVVLFGALWYFIMRQQGGANSKVMSFGKSKARMNDSDKNKVTFADVEGADEEKEELQEVVEFLKNPKKFIDLGARIPKGVLLVGPPGTGKTLLARASAGEAGVDFFSISGSDFVEMFVGVGASRVRDLFEQAKKHAPSIVFIDEIDAVGRHRGAGLGGGHDEREQTLNQLLVEMDGFATNEGVIIIAATNRPDILDPALLRPGRFDRQITVNYPDVIGREKILRLYSKGKPLSAEIDLEVLARRTPGFTGADLSNVMNEAALLSARRSRTDIGMEEIEEAITRVYIGPEKKSRMVTEKDKKLVAYHEAGHAIVANALPNCDPVHEVSIIPRGQAAGYTMTLPTEEIQHTSSAKLLDAITELLGGHAAEKLVLGDVSTGSTSDLKRATQIARNMITQYGMSKELGPVYLGTQQEVFLGKDFSSSRDYSEKVAATIDHETQTLLENCYHKAESVLRENESRMHKLVERLLQYEKVDKDVFESLMVEG